MPLASKKNQRTEKSTPAQSDVDVTPRNELEELPQVPKVTALIYSYNNAPGLRRCLAALEASTSRANLEILVVDKGSRDESSTLDSEFPNTTFLRLPRNFGNTKALNIAIRTSVGELVFFLTPEIEVHPDTVAQLVARLETDTESVAVAPLIIDQQGAPVEQVYCLPARQTGAQLVAIPVAAGSGSVAVEYHPFQAMMARKYFIRGINFLDERFGEFGADAEVCYQIRRGGRKVTVATDLTVLRTAAPARTSSAATTLLEADRIHGIAVYITKRHGFVSGLLFRLGQIAGALFQFRFGLFGELISFSKIDGSQSTSL